jgi:hypothetical protein
MVRGSARLERQDRGVRNNYHGSTILLAMLLGILVGVSIGLSLLQGGGILYDATVPPNQQTHISHSIRGHSESMEDGWKTIHVFNGAQDIMPTHASAEERAMPWQSQVHQDTVVFQMLQEKKGGYFIDLAANDPMWISNSYSLETHHDWKGLCIEGNPYLLDALSYRKCHVVGAVVSKKRMEKISYATRLSSASEASMGGIVGKEFDNPEVKQGETTITKYTVSLLEIFERFEVPRDIDYFSLDVEGAESMVLSSFPLDLYSFKILTIERPQPDAMKLLQSKGYVCLKNLRRFGETIWARKSAFSELDLSAVQLTKEAASVPGFCGCTSEYSNSCLPK